jgi:DNA-binding NtrC family response regulator
MPPTTADSAIDLLKKYSWPGNVRELKNVVQRILLDNETIITSEAVKEILYLQPHLQAPNTIDGVLFPHPEKDSVYK